MVLHTVTVYHRVSGTCPLTPHILEEPFRTFYNFVSLLGPGRDEPPVSSRLGETPKRQIQSRSLVFGSSLPTPRGIPTPRDGRAVLGDVRTRTCRPTPDGGDGRGFTDRRPKRKG